MTTIKTLFQKLFIPPERITPGMYHYQAPPEDPRNYRLHLRIEEDGQGILIINAATILHLNHTATEMAYYLIQNAPEDNVINQIASRYHVGREQARKDYQNFIGRIDTIISTPDLDPATFLDFERETPLTGVISAPYRLDCALTYRLPPDAEPEFAPIKQVTRELTTQEWITIIDKAWQAGIPHIVFTGGEPTLRDDLPALINKAEVNGQVTGLLTDGRRFVDPAYLDKLLVTGLDHIMIIWDIQHAEQWKALENTIREDLYVAVHLTLSPAIIPSVEKIIKRMADQGINGLSLSVSSPEYIGQLNSARELAATLQLSLTWNLPVPYSSQNPISLEVPDQKMEEGAGRAWLYIEPDGDVLPSQGESPVIGNLLTTSIEKIIASRVISRAN
jgi:organic radical activating enzyme